MYSKLLQQLLLDSLEILNALQEKSNTFHIKGNYFKSIAVVGERPSAVACIGLLLCHPCAHLPHLAMCDVIGCRVTWHAGANICQQCLLTGTSYGYLMARVGGKHEKESAGNWEWQRQVAGFISEFNCFFGHFEALLTWSSCAFLAKESRTAFTSRKEMQKWQHKLGTV